VGAGVSSITFGPKLVALIAGAAYAPPDGRRSRRGSASRAAGVVVLGLGIAGIGTPWTFIGIVPLATGLFNFCPLYTLLGINTCKFEK